MTTTTTKKKAIATTPKKTNGKRNRAAGHQWERDTVQKFRVIFPNVTTSRACNRVRDAEKVDLSHPDEVKFGRFPYNVQCKSCLGSVPYLKLLNEMPRDNQAMNVVFHRQTVRSRKGERILNAGELAVLKTDDFIELVKAKKAFELLNTAFEYLPSDIQKDLDKELTTLGI